jgi:hypothetical protein
VPGQVVPAPASDPEDDHGHRQQGADPDHGLEGDVGGVDRRQVGGRKGVEPANRLVEGAARDERAPLRDRQVAHGPTVDQQSAQMQGRGVLGGGVELEGGQLGRLDGAQRHPEDVADHGLDDRGDRRERQRNHQPEPVVGVAAPAQHPGGVHGRDDEADEHVGAQPHVGELQERAWVEHRAPGVHVGHPPAGGEGEAGGHVHPGVDGDDAVAAEDAGGHHRREHPQVQAGRKPVPAVEVDAQEDRFGEERQALERERQPEDIAEAAHQSRPQQPHLEAEHRAGDGADGEQHGGHLRPALRQSQRGLVPAQAATVHHEDHRRKGDAEGGQDDVPAQ